MRKKLSILFISLLCLFIFSNYSSAQDYPDATQEFYVNDFANVLDSPTKKYIVDFSHNLEQQTKAQVVVVTVDSLEGQPLEIYSYGLFNDWKIGDSSLDNGVLILVSVGDRSSRIEVGRGLEGALPDGKTGRIQDNYMIPHFLNHDYSQGIKLGYSVIMNEVFEEYGIDSSNFETTLELPPEEHSSTIFDIFVFIIVALVLVIDWIFFKGRITRSLFKLLLLISMFSRRGRYNRGSGGFSGGGGTFGGGGRSGGGGSSRRW
ncbi:TPM domain-containing protein [Herbivorax sp. ANBcel31]|uniref:TPM domain-containing protein n=1 Tax=Herbivorax sp. ANBcel31 TaxID=3069754 RepID=UPI0027B69D9B|nr:TPM domain-containing protein [Herbivorax sp. ANBcel31]MDQ2087881.1 TPM domain-containing protein [Herbivorax sp. ANBcel31]